MIVADANLLINYVCGTPLSDMARQVNRQDPDWVSPPLWKAEVLNGLLVMHRAGLMSLDRAVLAYRNAAAATSDPLREDNPDAILTTAQDAGLTAYDAIYVTLARSLGIPLVTEDGKILRTCPDVARSMRQFLEPPESSMTVREKPATYKTARKSGKGAKA